LTGGGLRRRIPLLVVYEDEIQISNIIERGNNE
jgi:hypothetical protein